MVPVEREGEHLDAQVTAALERGDFAEAHRLCGRWLELARESGTMINLVAAHETGPDSLGGRRHGRSNGGERSDGRLRSPRGRGAAAGRADALPVVTCVAPRRIRPTCRGGRRPLYHRPCPTGPGDVASAERLRQRIRDGVRTWAPMKLDRLLDELGVRLTV